ncbi:uncharacterized protein LOC133918138 [Phragmites australis]|uniref:uncharacterized protein LOC133918138 n=1 Tax=Phragmites australis TaxID=29695 RepID=UPI002D787F56|nr:uncharacterized protein LOC133918138 [Phragmites australis]
MLFLYVRLHLHVFYDVEVVGGLSRRWGHHTTLLDKATEGKGLAPRAEGELAASSSSSSSWPSSPAPPLLSLSGIQIRRRQRRDAMALLQHLLSLKKGIKSSFNWVEA